MLTSTRARYNFAIYAAESLWTALQISFLFAYSVSQIAIIAPKTAPTCDVLHFVLLATAGIGLLTVFIQCAIITYNYQELNELVRAVYVPLWIYFIPCLIQCYLYFAIETSCKNQYENVELVLWHGNMIVFLIFVLSRAIAAVFIHVRRCIL